MSLMGPSSSYGVISPLILDPLSRGEETEEGRVRTDASLQTERRLHSWLGQAPTLPLFAPFPPEPEEQRNPKAKPRTAGV